VLRSDQAGFETLHTYFLDRLVPVCGRLLDAASEAGQLRASIEPFALLRGVGNLCSGGGGGPGEDPRRLVALLTGGLGRGDWREAGAQPSVSPLGVWRMESVGVLGSSGACGVNGSSGMTMLDGDGIRGLRESAGEAFPTCRLRRDDRAAGGRAPLDGPARSGR